MLFFIACSTTTKHGIIINEKDISAIKINLTRIEDVRAILGEPSFIWKDKWYYVSSATKQRAFFNSKIEKHEVYAMSFQNKTVSQIEHFTKADITRSTIKKQKLKVEKPNLHELFE
jgi:outer membrane protein assembly factor BamE (lipoprotein component of BamABCDE complex)